MPANNGPFNHRIVPLTLLALLGVLTSVVGCNSSDGSQEIPASATAPQSIRTEECENISVTDPAASYCALMGYPYAIQNTANGQTVVCTFPDGSSCDEWAFYAGTCGERYSYCALNNYGTKPMDDGNDPYSQTYSVCVDAQGNTVGSVTELTGLGRLLDACQ